MKFSTPGCFLLVLLAATFSLAVATAENCRAAVLAFVGSEYDIGGTFFPGGDAPYVVVPWRSEGTAKNFDLDGNNVYGSAGYALFATQFNWPSIECCGSTVVLDSQAYPDLVQLPSFVDAAQVLVTSKVGGWNYALVDDPTLVNGYRDFNWGDNQAPPVDPPHSQSPYVKIGVLEGNDILGNNPQTGLLGAARWGFQIGADPPEKIRVGVMTDGLDAPRWAATEVILARVVGTTPVDFVASGTLARNRHVDLHTFDILDAQPGQQFVVLARASSNGLGAISGITFDAVPEPSTASLLVLLIAAGLGALRTRLG